MDFKILKKVGTVFGHIVRATAIASIVMLGIPMLYESAAVEIRLGASVYEFMNSFFLIYIIYFLHVNRSTAYQCCFFIEDQSLKDSLSDVPGSDEEESDQSK